MAKKKNKMKGTPKGISSLLVASAGGLSTLSTDYEAKRNLNDARPGEGSSAKASECLQ